MKRLHLALLLSACAAAAVTTAACGGISDPTKGGGEGTVATVSGALTGTAVPANARVALVFRNPKGFGAGRVQVAGDAPVIGGQFTISLGVPSDALFAPLGGDSSFDSSEPPSVSGGSAAGSSSGSSGSSGVPEPVPAGGSSGSGKSAPVPGTMLSPRDSVSGQITAPLSAAFAGFVVYADTNGNGQLDINGDTIASTDQLLGGNRELALVYLKDGGALDYEKLRDKSGILPASGYNLAWDEGRWLPLDVVELKLGSNPQLPTAVCHSHGVSGVSGVSEEKPDLGGSSGISGSTDAGVPSNYPSPNDPDLQCSNGGRTFTYSPISSCPPYTPPVPGLCSGDSYNTTAPCAGGYWQSTLSPTQPIPEGWPCPVADAIDGGSFDGGAIDGGSADGG